MILVTGINGYIGDRLKYYLSQESLTFKGLDTNFFYKDQKSKTLFKDVRNIQIEDLNHVTDIIHLAGLSDDPSGSILAENTFEINYEATINLAKLAKSKGVKKFIFSSSCSVYGQSGSNIVNEQSICDPYSEYAKSKYQSEIELLDLHDNNFKVYIMRNATAFGISENMRNDLVVSNLIISGILENKIIVLSNGKPWRPLVNIDDISRAIILFLKDDNFFENPIFNIGKNEMNYTVKQIAEIVSDCFYPKLNVEVNDKMPDDPRSYRVNFDKLKNNFPNFKFKFDLKNSIKDIFNFLKNINPQNLEYLLGHNFVRKKKIIKLIEDNDINKKFFWK